jgi:hypothetical protein
MEFFITEYCKVERVEDGVAVVSVRVPVELLDDVMDLTTHVLNGARILKMKSRMVAASACQPLARFGVKNK